VIVINNVVYDFRKEVLETGEIVAEVEWFGVLSECFCCFDDDKVVYFVLVFVHANLEPVEFGVYENEVIDFAARCAVGIR